MSAASVIVFYGAKFLIQDDDISLCEARIHPLQIAARKSDLDHYWGNFDTPNEKYLLFIGKLLGKFGIEECLDQQFTLPELVELDKSITNRIQASGITDRAVLHVHFQPD